MKETKQTKPVQTEAHKNALAIAQTIQQVMGTDFFTIDQMRKKMIVPSKNSPGKQRPLAWSEARGYVVSLIPYGLVKSLPNVKDCYQIRLDYAFQKTYFENQIFIREAEIAELKDLIIIMEPSIPKEQKIITEENKKTAKAVKTPKTDSKK